MTRDEIRRAVEKARVTFKPGKYQALYFYGAEGDDIGVYLPETGEHPPDALVYRKYEDDAFYALCPYTIAKHAIIEEADAIRAALAADTPTPEQVDCLTRHGLR